MVEKKKYEPEATDTVPSTDSEYKNDETESRGSFIKGEKNMNEIEKINFGSEYGSSITESLTHRQYLSDCAWILENFNPIRRILIYREEMPDDESKKLIEGFTKSDMPSFLEKCRKISENCLDVGMELSDISKELSRKRKGRIEKY